MDIVINGWVLSNCLPYVYFSSYSVVVAVVVAVVVVVVVVAVTVVNVVVVVVVAWCVVVAIELILCDHSKLNKPNPT